MKTTKNIARLAVTAGLAAALSFGGVMAPVTMAFAADAADGSVTIENVKDNATEFKGYQIFKADVATVKGETVASNITWANDDVEKAVEKVIHDNDSSYAGKTAQDAADWITSKVTGTSETTRVKSDSIAYGIAAAVDDLATTATTENHVASGLSHGYWLFVTDSTTIGKEEVGTSPIFTVVGSVPVEITEKTGIPTVVKKIKDDKPGSDWADKADSQMGQDVHYQLTGTVADNIATFDTYHYEFHDELSAGLTANANTVEVKIGDKTLLHNSTEGNATGYDVSIDDATNTLTVKFDDLKAAAKQVGATLDGSSNVVVTYTAMLDPAKAANVTVGSTGNDNTVRLTYSNNPMSGDKGESVPDTVRDYTYALKLVKEDSVDESTKLNGVKFTIQATNPDDNAEGAPAGIKYVQENGTLSETKCEFETKNGGVIDVNGLDAGTYTVHEVEGSNPGYNTLDDFTFTIKSEGLNKDEGVALDEYTAVNTLKVTVQKNDSATMVTPSVDGGTVTLTVQNKKGSNLPLTGLNGVTFTWIAGGAVLCIGVAHLIRSRKRDEGSEE